MNASQRMALNTVASYMRSVLAISLTLFSSRWVLHALGQSDFGLFNVVGSIIVFITFLNTIMSNSAARHFAYSMGQGGSSEINRWFNAALSIHLCLGAVLVVLGWPVGEYLIGHVLTIPPERLLACRWVFRVSLVSAFFSMASVPFVAMFTANQRIAELAVWGSLQVVLAFALAWCLSDAPGDRLLFYAIVMVGIVVLTQVAQVLRAFWVFKECRVVMAHWFDGRRHKEIFSFAGWNLIGGVGYLLKTQGSALLLNIYFGPTVNASYGIANQVSNATNQLSSALMGAFSPEITSSEGRGDRPRMLSLSQRSNKIGTLLVLLFAIPLMLEMDYVLRMWLKDPPAYTALFCRLILASYLIDRLSTGYMLAVNAHGKVAAYQATVGVTMILTLPLAWVFLRLGYAPTSVGVAFILTMLVCSWGRVYCARLLFGVTFRSWWSEVVGPCLAVALTTVLIAGPVRMFFDGSFVRFASVSGLSIAATIGASWFVAFDEREHRFLRHNSIRAIEKTRLFLRRQGSDKGRQE